MEATITEETAHIIKAQMKNMKQGNVLMFDEVTGGFVTVVIQIGMTFAVHRKPKPKPQEQST